MSRESRLELLKRIEETRGSKVLCYVAGDRRGLETKIANDVFPIFHKHLMKMGRQEKIDLFLYSTGGLTMAGYALVNLVREFCHEFNVLIPFKALSCATLIALGADEIVMTPMGQLSPIDPSVEHPLGPTVQLPGQPQARIAPVNVEDVNAFVGLAKDEFGLQEEDSMTKVFNLLASNVHPLALGAVQRSREQIAFLAANLLNYHCDDEQRIEQIVNTVTRERFSHSYIICRREAKETLGLNIVEPNSDETTLMVGLLNDYNVLLSLDVPYNPELELGASDSGTFLFRRAIIESEGMTHVYSTQKEIRRMEVQRPGIPIPVEGYQERILRDGWTEDNSV